MFNRILILLALTCTFIYAQAQQPVYSKEITSPVLNRLLFTETGLLNNEDKKQSSTQDRDSTLFTQGYDSKFGLKLEPERSDKPVLNKLSFVPSGIWNSPYKEIPLQPDTKNILSYQNHQTRLTKFAISQMLFAGMGVLDYAIKEAPMYPGYRKDTFFWQSAWGTMVWGTSIGLNMLAVKDLKYILGLLTEDMSYYLCRKVFHKQNFPAQFGLPFKVMGAEKVPMRAMLIIWAASVTYLALDALELF